MQLPRNAALVGFAALTLTTAAWAADKPTGLPIADPPAVLGEPYSVDGKTYSPADAPFDDVGHAGLDVGAGTGVSVSHRTLPLPSYVEITALDSGRTILARVERRGPMTGTQMVALSAAGFAQLGADSDQPLAVRVRRVNPQEYERALLRTNQRAPERLVTPGPLLEVLRKLLAAKFASAPIAVLDLDPVASVPAVVSPPTKPAAVKAVAVKAVAIKPAVAKPVTAKPAVAKPAPAKAATAPPAGAYAVQAASFASRANADATARKLSGKVGGSGKLWRVQLGPFANRGAAEAGLARAKKAGFGDARIVTAGE